MEGFYGKNKGYLRTQHREWECFLQYWHQRTGVEFVEKESSNTWSICVWSARRKGLFSWQ